MRQERYRGYLCLLDKIKNDARTIVDHDEYPDPGCKSCGCGWAGELIIEAADKLISALESERELTRIIAGNTALINREQRPENTEFRTREELEALASSYINRHYLPECWSDVGAMVAEMMASGAAEQRRGDAEGAEPVAWMYRTRDGSHCVTRYIEEAELEGIEIFPLSYTHPANVAALETRVKELEAQLGALQHGTVRQVIHSPLRHFKPEDRS